MVLAVTPELGQSTISSWPTRCRNVIALNARCAGLTGCAGAWDELRRLEGLGVVDEPVDEPGDGRGVWPVDEVIAALGVVFRGGSAAVPGEVHAHAAIRAAALPRIGRSRITTS
jgi:hypothetical protein